MTEKTKQEILEFLQKIPKGKVSTYKKIGEKFGVHPRAVAIVMKHNKKPEIYPCYKVIASSGKISGYNAEGWISEKILKLQNDGIVIIDGKIGEEFVW